MLEGEAGGRRQAAGNAAYSPVDGWGAAVRLKMRDGSPLADGNYADFAHNSSLAVVPPPRGAIDFPL